MKQLNLSQMEQLNGGFWGYATCLLAGAALAAAFVPGALMATVMYGPALTAGCVAQID